MHLTLTARTAQGNFGIKRVFLPPSVYIRAHAHTFIAPAALMRGFFFSFRVYIYVYVHEERKKERRGGMKKRGGIIIFSPPRRPRRVCDTNAAGVSYTLDPLTGRLASCGPVCASVYVSVALVSARGSS